MNISRENYEIWFTDWFDNKLTSPEIEELNFFLDQNPDLRDEFTDLCAFTLKPVSSSPRVKDMLKRNPAEIPAGQFELLCAAAAENDLDSGQEAELREILLSDPEKAGTPEIYKRLKLKAPSVEYQGKTKLLKKTIATRVIRLTWIGLSAAAVVSILLLTGVFRQREIPGGNPMIAREKTQTVPPEQSVNSREAMTASRQQASPTGNSENHFVARADTQPAQSKVTETAGGIPDRIVAEVPEKITFTAQPEVTESSMDLLAASSNTYKPSEIVYHDDERSNVGKFIAKHFRSKVLDEELPSDAPLKGYEIAEAGIEGLNKLLGWEMALTRSTDQNGDAESVRFSSRILKFNAPVKNNSVSE